MKHNYPNEHLSISSLQSFWNCPFSFHMKYICGIEPPQKDKAKDGGLFQLALNAKYRGEDPLPVIKDMDAKKRGIATLLLGQAYNFNDIISIDEPYKIDLGFGAPMMFIPDLLTRHEIVENKYTTGYYNSKMVMSERQRIVYYLGVRKLFGFDPKVKYQIFNTKNKSVELVETPTTTRDIDELMDWIENTLGMVDKCISTDNWDHGQHSWCDWPLVCPLGDRYPKPKRGGRG
jgi:hypothetical protein